MEWGNEDSLKLIEVYKQYPVLWDYKHDFYHNKTHKQKAWSEIANIIGTPMLEVKRKMESLLSSLRREKAKGKIVIGTGDDSREAYRSKWFAFKSLSFIVDRDEVKKQPNYVENSDGSSTFDGSDLTMYENAQETEDAPMFSIESVYQVNTTPGPSAEASNPTEEQSKDRIEYKVTDFQSNAESTYNPPEESKSNTQRNSPDEPKSTTQRNSTEESKSNTQRNSRDESNSTRRIPKKKARKRPAPASDCEDDPRIDEALEILKTAVTNKVRSTQKDDCSVYGEHVANKLREYSKRTKAIVQHHISNILFQADMGQFDEPSYRANLISNSTALSSLLANLSRITNDVTPSSSSTIT